MKWTKETYEPIPEKRDTFIKAMAIEFGADTGTIFSNIKYPIKITRIDDEGNPIAFTSANGESSFVSSELKNYHRQYFKKVYILSTDRFSGWEKNATYKFKDEECESAFRKHVQLSSYSQYRVVFNKIEFPITVTKIYNIGTDSHASEIIDAVGKKFRELDFGRIQYIFDPFVLDTFFEKVESESVEDTKVAECDEPTLEQLIDMILPYYPIRIGGIKSPKNSSEFRKVLMSIRKNKVNELEKERKVHSEKLSACASALEKLK